MVRQLSIDQFENEGRRVSYGTPENATAARKLLDRQMSINSVPKKVDMFISAVILCLELLGTVVQLRKDVYLYCYAAS